ncbi:MAG: hypothetical protein QOG38_1669, partial [Hyphomicrobiales bacterium]|nr:hypothetical protein [Hyphomicrobiales bacterium]
MRRAPVTLAVALALACSPAVAQDSSLAGAPIVRDSEIEQLMRDYTAPILRAAGLAQQNIQVVLINERA